MTSACSALKLGNTPMHEPDNNSLELALRASNEGIWKWDLSENKIHYSPLLLKFMGNSPEQPAPHLFENIENTYHPDDVAKLQSILTDFMLTSGNETFGADCRYNHPDGSPRWFRIRGACNRDNSGAPTLIAGSVIDITQRKKSELLLAEEKHLLNLLTESIPINIYFKDVESKFVMANTATAQKVGLKCAKDIIGKTDHDFFDPIHADSSRKDEVMVMFTKENLEGALEKEVWDGHAETWCITSKHPWLDQNGKIKGTFGVTNDVSEIVHTQNRLKKISNIYKKRNDQYIEELKLATEVQQAILAKKIPSLTNNFTATFSVSHTPMHGLAGDFYEAIPISDTKMGILMCDVMGHGVRASLIVAMIRGLISKEQASASIPQDFLENLNKGLCHILSKAGITMFSTAIYSVIDVKKATITMANAGHPIPIIKQKSHFKLTDPSSIKAGTALGLIPNSQYNDSILKLEDLDEIILYTDGIYEVINNKQEELGIKNLINKMNSNKTNNLSSIQNLSNIAIKYSHDQKFNDDVCLLSVKFKKNITTWTSQK